VLPTRLIIRRSCGAYLKTAIPTAHETI
jgi:hypothetical protein